MKKRVLRIINRLNLGGPTYNVTYLSKFMDDEYDTLLVAGIKLESEASSEFIINKYEINATYVKHMYREINIFNDIKAYYEIKKIIKEFKPDIVHTHAAKSGALGRLAAYSEKVPVIIHTFHGHVFHSYFSKFKTNLYILIEKFLANKSTCIIAISNEQKKELSNKFNICSDKKIKVIPLGFDLKKFQEKISEKRNVFREKYNLNKGELGIGIVGRLTAIKNHTFFLDMIKIVKNKTNKKLRFFIVGDGEDMSKLKSYCNIHEINFTDHNDAIHDKTLCFTSWIKDIDVVYSGLDIVTLTSLNEGTPVAIIEALAANKPVVCTRVGGIEDVVDENKNGFIVDKNDVLAFSNKLLKLIEDNKLRNAFSSCGFNHVQNRYSYLRLVDDMKNLYSKLLP
tara:strand:- start:5104 stop:6291 length:1188 start_codon:yes stop_codon:yes gene_type:complete